MRKRITDNPDFLTSEFAQSTNSDSISLEGAEGFSIVAAVTVSTPSAKNFLAGESEVTTLTFPDKATIGAGDYIVLEDTAGLKWAVYADKSGTEADEPTGAIYVAIPAGRKAAADLSGATTAAEVAAAFELALDALTDTPFATDDTAADGTIEVTHSVRGVATNASPKNADDSGAGGITVSVDNEGVASAVDPDEDTLTHSLAWTCFGTQGSTHYDGNASSGSFSGDGLLHHRSRC